MKTPLLPAVVALVLFSTSLFAGPRDAQWRSVEDAAKNRLPRSAIEQLQPIIDSALADKAYPEAVRAIVRRIVLESEFEGGRPEERIVRLQTELEKAPAPMRPMMECILADWYWQYFQNNRWKFAQRTQTAGASPGADLRTWDLAQILREIDRHFAAALSDDVLLKATPIGTYDVLLEKGTVPDRYRPTLFDFLVNEALRFYQAGEQAGVAAEEEFEIAADGPIFGDVAAFAGWRPQTVDTESPKLKAVRLYQSLLKFHERDSDRSAYLDADLARLRYGFNVATGDDKIERYRAALERFTEANAKHEISARATALLAGQYRETDPAMAHELAKRGLNAYPKTAGGAECFNLIQEIEAPSAQIDTEFVWTAPWPTLNVTYRNLTKVYFRAIPLDYVEDVVRREDRGTSDEQLAALLQKPPALEWNAVLPATMDFKVRTERLPAPMTLKPGYYAIVASHSGRFTSTKEERVSVQHVWVSRLALVMRTWADGGPQTGFVLDAESGEPIAGAAIRLWRGRSIGGYTELPSTKTDENGRFEFPGRNDGVIALAQHGDQAVSTAEPLFVFESRPPRRSVTHTTFFTDRALYRPGQTISYKGVTSRSDEQAGAYSVVADEDVTVVFRDPNGKEIARATHRTNDYGSFSGTFTAPRDRLLGEMTIRTEDRDGGTNFAVEEYKRPKFQVELLPPAEAPKLAATVELRGKATAYTGAPIGGAKVKWRVERSVRLPYWCWWGKPQSRKAIAHGTAVTEPDGTFRIPFTAEPDRTVPEKYEPTFAFTAYADVVDTTGETRSAERTVRCGYSALAATVTADEWQTPDKPVELTVATTSLDGDPQPAAGTIALHELKQPAQLVRADLAGYRPWQPWRASLAPVLDGANPDTWEMGAVVARLEFRTDEKGKAKLSSPLQPGVYRAMLETKDRFGRAVTARQTLRVLDPNAAHLPIRIANVLAAPKWSLEPGETFTALWGTGYERGRAFVELECDGKPLKSYWTEPDRTQALISEPVTEAMRGGLTLRVTYVRENRAYVSERIVSVPWSNKELSVRWETFRSKLQPGQKETWTAIVSGPDKRPHAAEMVATLYDSSLDQYRVHEWTTDVAVFRSEQPVPFWLQFANQVVASSLDLDSLRPDFRSVRWRHRAFPPSLRLGPGGRRAAVMSDDEDEDDEALIGYSAMTTLAGTRLRRDAKVSMAAQMLSMPEPGTEPVASKPDLSKVSARRNLQETAFFYPHLLAGEDGVVKIQFTAPEALTEWKFLGFAHDAQLRAGLLTDKAVTSKDLMVEPNPPRFLREGDAIEFTVKVSNRSVQPQSGTVRLTFADAATQQSRDAALGNRVTDQAFAIPAKESRSFSWRIAVPDGLEFLSYKVVAASARFSDGEEGWLPVLSRRVLVTESLPLPMRGPGTRQFEFAKLLASGASPTLRSESLTVQMVSQPAWYAVLALPYLMEFPYECSEQVFNRFYANQLAAHIAGSDPKIRQVFDLWKATPALDSPLAKNADLKAVALEETPWVAEAASESQARRNIGLLFDANRLESESAATLHKLAERQGADGLWPWFPGGATSEYISLYIVAGFGRLRHFGAQVDDAPAVKALAGLDARIVERVRRIRTERKPESYVPNPFDALYLYARSFFLDRQPLDGPTREAVDFLLGQARKLWTKVGSRQTEAHLALALQRFGDTATPAAILKSLKERSVSDPELGMFWRDTEDSWWWYGAPIETQALMIEAFAEVGHDAAAVEDCKVWLLKQKQTQDWRTTKATADAVYALLLQGRDLLASDARVEVALGGEPVKPDKVEAGTGFFEQRFSRGEIKPAMGRITVTKTDDGVSWGGVHWQYFEDVSRVTPHEGTPLKVTKALFVKETTARGPVLTPVTGPVSVGDELVVRLELRTDRDLEFVHLKDQRGSGVEPVNVLSGYRYQDGLGYYEATRDTATHFFFERLPKGVHVFEYPVRVQLRGSYQSGLAEIQCMYAPEFNSHSDSVRLEVR